MKVTIDIPDMYVSILSKWASVSRTLNNARNCCDKLSLLTDEEPLRDTAYLAKDELDDITEALDNLHQTVRNQIWAQQKDRIILRRGGPRDGSVTKVVAGLTVCGKTAHGGYYPTEEMVGDLQVWTYKENK